MRLLIPLLVASTLVIPLNSLSAQEKVTNSLEAMASDRLADEFIRVARKATMNEPLDTLSIMAAVELVKEASKLSPHNPSILQSMIEVAQMADLPDLSKKAIQELLFISPDDTSLQLARLRCAIEITNTADQRLSVYDQLLSAGKSAQLDARVASRLALDAALLQRQLGNINQFAWWLAEAVALDPANPDAVILAAGFFGDETADVYTRAEFLSTAMLSNIRDATLQVSLAEFLMAYGDYEDANAMYQVIIGDTPADALNLSEGLLADITLCMWAAGDAVGAQDLILSRQIGVDKAYRQQTKRQQPRLTPLELARIHAPLSPKLSTVRAAIYADQADNSIASTSLDSAVLSIVSVANLTQMQSANQMTKVIELYLQAAWVAIWFGEDVEMVQTLLRSIEEGAIIHPVEQTRLEGWILLKKGELEAAIEMLASIPEDAPAQAGLGLAYLKQGNKRAAARQFLHIAKNQSGSILGVWSKKQLKEIVKSDFDIHPEVKELRQLMTGVLETMNDYALDPRSVIGIHINPTLQTYNPFEPIYIDIELTNNTALPLTIAKNGPVQPVLLIEALLQIPGTSASQNAPIIVPINQQISFLPKQSLVIRVDLRQYWVGEILNMFPTSGASLKLRATVNFMARETKNIYNKIVIVYDVDTLGSTTSVDGLRVDGVRLNDLWLQEALSKVEDIQSIDDLTKLVLLTWIVGDDVMFAVEKPLITPPPGEELTPTMIGDRLKLQDDAITKVLTIFPSLDAVSQAWVVSTMSNDPTTEAVVGMLKDPESTIAQLSWIIRFAYPDVPDEALDDPRLLAAMSSDNITVKTVASWVYTEVERVAKQREIEQLGPYQE